MPNQEQIERDFEQWKTENRALWYVEDGRPYFGGIWKVRQEFTGEIMILEDITPLPNWQPEWFEVHTISDDRPDKYNMDLLVQRFKKAGVIKHIQDMDGAPEGTTYVFDYKESDLATIIVTLKQPFDVPEEI